MVYLFTAVFGATWLTVPWLYPAEIFPLSVRAKGNAWGVIGWSIGNGWLTLLCPVMFDAIGEKTLYIFGACNILSIPSKFYTRRVPWSVLMIIQWYGPSTLRRTNAVSRRLISCSQATALSSGLPRSTLRRSRKNIRSLCRAVSMRSMMLRMYEARIEQLYLESSMRAKVELENNIHRRQCKEANPAHKTLVKL
jgi:hypothetical protein